MKGFLGQTSNDEVQTDSSELGRLLLRDSKRSGVSALPG